MRYYRFIQLFWLVFDHAPEGKELGERLLPIKQGSRRAMEYALDFHTLTAEIGWNKPAIKLCSDRV